MEPGIRMARGRAFRYDNRRIVYAYRTEDGAYVFFDGKRHPVELTHDQVLLARESNDLLDWFEKDENGTPEAADGSKGLAPTRITMTLANEGEKAETLRRVDYCLEWAAQPVPRTKDRLTALAQKVYDRRKRAAGEERRFEEPPPSASTYNDWLKNWLAAGRSIEGLVPQKRNRGSRATKLRYDVGGLIADMIHDHYLTRQRLSVAKVHKLIVKEVQQINRGLPALKRLREPCYETVLRATNSLCGFTVLLERHGKAHAREHYRAIGSGYITERANEVWEADDTVVNLMCVAEDRKTAIGRPWLLAVIDRHTRMIVAVVVTFVPPDTGAVMEALKIGILGKERLLKGYPDIQGTYPARGKPQVLHVDNGKHYNSEALKRSLQELGIGHRTMPVLKAWFKGVIERFFRTVSEQVFETVPGTTFSGIYERDRETPPEEIAIATIDELREKLWKWLVEDYQTNPHKGIDDTPLRLWMKCEAKHGFDLVPTREEVEVALSLTVARRPRKDGLQFHNLHYHSEHLAGLRMASRDREAAEVIIRVDEGDLRTIQFCSPLDGKWYPAYLRKDLVPRVEGRTLEEYDRACALRRGQKAEFAEADPDFKESYGVLDRARDEAADSKRMADRRRAEGEKERILRDARRLTEPKGSVAIPKGQDLSSRVDREGGHSAAPAGATPAPDQATPMDLTEWQARNGTGGQVRRKKKED